MGVITGLAMGPISRMFMIDRMLWVLARHGYELWEWVTAASSIDSLFYYLLVQDEVEKRVQGRWSKKEFRYLGSELFS